VRPIAGVAACAFALVSHAVAQEKKMGDGPRITAVAPFALTPGQTTTLRVRGLKLDSATAAIVQPATAGVVVEKGEAKKSPPPNGADPKKYGDTEVEVKLTAPAASTPLQLVIETSAGRTPPVPVQVVAASDSVEEKEPNGGFREAQPIAFSKIVRGCINADKDVDVYRFDGKRGMKIAIVAEAARWPSLADPMLTLFSVKGQIVAFGSAPAGGDCRIDLALPADGTYYVSVLDAQDSGGPWHCYHLTVKETP
jgi:hypothetical protein